VIFRRDRKRKDTEEEPLEASGQASEEAAAESADKPAEATDKEDLAALDALDWRDDGPWDIGEVEDLDLTDEGQRIDLGSLIITGVPGSELRLQVAEETKEIVSAMLVIETELPASDAKSGGAQMVSSALELGAYAAPRSGGLWAELREEISEAATAQGGSASLREGPFGVELYRFIPVTTPDGEQGYQPSRMWVAEGPRWLLRGIVYGQAAVEDDPDSPVVADVLSAFRQVIVRRGEEAMAPGDLLPLSMPSAVASAVEGN
jgi:Protein of unknown function (DUF3710)